MLKHNTTNIWRHIKTWPMIGLLIMSIGMNIWLLRLNSLGMDQRRDQVIAADTIGDDLKTKQAIVELQRYVSNHMNTDMSDRVVYLAKTYQRAYERAVQAGLKANTVSHSLYDQADAACQATFKKTYSFPAYTQCVAGKLAGLAGNDPLNNVKAPIVDLYRYDFVSPVWTPDPAGLSLLVSAGLSLVVLGQLFTRVIRRYLV